MIPRKRKSLKQTRLVVVTLLFFFNGWHITLTEYLSSKDVNLQDSIVYLQMENEKVRGIPHTVVAPLAVSGKCSLYT